MVGDEIRAELQAKVLAAAAELLRVTGAEAFALPVPGSEPLLFVAAGSADAIRGLMGPSVPSELDG